MSAVLLLIDPRSSLAATFSVYSTNSKFFLGLEICSGDDVFGAYMAYFRDKMVVF